MNYGIESYCNFECYEICLFLAFYSIVVSRNIGQIFGAELGKWLAPKFGPACSLKWNGVFLGFCLIIQQLSGFFVQWKLLLIGRLLQGISLGVVLVVVPVFLNEVSPKYCKGAMSVLHAFMMNFGSLLACIIGLPEVLGSHELL